MCTWFYDILYVPALCSLGLRRTALNWSWTHPVLSYVSSFPIPDMLCDPIQLIGMQGTPFEAMTGLTAYVDGLLAEVFPWEL